MTSFLQLNEFKRLIAPAVQSRTDTAFWQGTEVSQLLSSAARRVSLICYD